MNVIRPIAADMRATFDAQRAAFLRAGAPSLQERRADLKKLVDAIGSSGERLAAEISADFGHRSRHETEIGEIFPAQSAIRHTLRHLARWMRPKRVAVGFELMPAGARILYQPVGVVGIISPWNYPFNLAIVPLVAALAAGNRVMLKPSELTPRTSDFLAELLAGLFPPEQVATIVGGPEVGQAFARLPFDHLFYTGSTAVGRLVMQAAADNLTPVTLELGGKSPCIIGEDAALPSAAESIVHGKLLNAGQTCIAPDYVLLPQQRLDEFVSLATETARKFYPTLAQNPDYSSIINERHYRRVAQYVAEAKAKGVRAIEINPAHDALPADARKLPPTLLIEPGDDLSVMREEIFGPVLPVKTYRSLDEAIDTSTDTRVRSRFIISAPTPRSGTRCCAGPSRAAQPSTGRCFISPRRICRSAASDRPASAPITGNSASRPSRTARASSCRAASAGRASSIRRLDVSPISC